MREDFSKVLVERPRGGYRGARSGTVRATRSALRYDDESFPSFESSSRHRGGTKYLNENLGPLVRFLRGSVGRPWNDVYAELSQHVNRRNTVQAHVFQHLFDYVAMHAVMRDGLLVDANRGVPLRHRTYFFVSPETHRLLLVPASTRPRRRWPEVPDAPQVGVGRWSVDRLVEGVWFRIALAPLPRSELVSVHDVVRGKIDVTNWSGRRVLERTYGRAGVYGVSKRALDKREIRQGDLWRVAEAFDAARKGRT